MEIASEKTENISKKKLQYVRRNEIDPSMYPPGHRVNTLQSGNITFMH
jgi:hypothetical protein